MQSINAGFQSLKTLIPHTDGEKLSKVGRGRDGFRRRGPALPSQGEGGDPQPDSFSPALRQPSSSRQQSTSSLLSRRRPDSCSRIRSLSASSRYRMGNPPSSPRLLCGPYLAHGTCLLPAWACFFCGVQWNGPRGGSSRKSVHSSAPGIWPQWWICRIDFPV